MKFRLVEGQGIAIYLIGVYDDGYPKGISKEDLEESLINLCEMARNNRCDVTMQTINKGYSGYIAIV